MFIMCLQGGKMSKFTDNLPDFGDTFVVVCFFLIPLTGYLMNFQNLWEYWPEGGKLINLSLYWIISLLGIFFPPLGTITGFVW